MKAAGIWLGAGHTDVMEVTTVPIMWCLADHDPIIDTQELLAQSQKLMDLGADASFYVNSPTPLYPLYFVNIAELDHKASTQLFSELLPQGYLDEDYFLIATARISGWEKHSAWSILRLFASTFRIACSWRTLNTPFTVTATIAYVISSILIPEYQCLHRSDHLTSSYSRKLE